MSFWNLSYKIRDEDVIIFKFLMLETMLCFNTEEIIVKCGYAEFFYSASLVFVSQKLFEP